MDYIAEIRGSDNDPQRLEQLYQAARREGQDNAFRAAVCACFEAAPDNLLYAAWFHRLQLVAEVAPPSASPHAPAWGIAIPLSVLTGLIFWVLSSLDYYTVSYRVPQVFIWWSPVATISALAFLVLATGKGYIQARALGLGLAAITAYSALVRPDAELGWRNDQYPVLAAIHLPLLCWTALGLAVLKTKSDTDDRFAFLIKSIEVIITAGLYLIAGGVFAGITVGLFYALDIELPELAFQLLFAGGFGLLPVLALATVYDPHRSPSEQDFNQGLSKFISTMMRLLLPLTLSDLARAGEAITCFRSASTSERNELGSP